MQHIAMINNTILRDRSLEEIKNPQYNLHYLRSCEHLQDIYYTNILSINTFKMTEREYNIALKGMPLSTGNCLYNT